MELSTIREPGALSLPTSLPANAEIFKFPPELAWVMLGGVIFFLGLSASGFILSIVHPERRSLVLMAISILGGGSIGTIGLRSFRRLRDSVVVNPEGVWYLPRRGNPTFIAWHDVATIKADDTQQRLVLLDASGTKKIRLEYQLTDFSRLRDYVIHHASASTSPHAPIGNIFHRTWINKILSLVFAVPSLLLAWAVHHQGRPGVLLLFIGIAGYFLAIFMRDPTTLEITHDAIEIKYLGWRKNIPFSTITAISLKDIPDRRGDGNVWAAVVIERQHADPIKLFRFREGSIALHEALESAWRASGAAAIQT
jgi:hypothetical protein